MNFRQIRKQIKNEPEAFDVNSIEDQIGELVSQEVPRRPLQDYAAHQTKEAMYHAQKPPPTVEEVDAVTAEAVMLKYATVEKTISEMKEPLADLAQKHQLILADLAAAMTYLEETAARFRQLGEESRDQITRTSAVITKIRAMCAATTAEIELPGPSTPA